MVRERLLMATWCLCRLRDIHQGLILDGHRLLNLDGTLSRFDIDVE